MMIMIAMIIMIFFIACCYLYDNTYPYSPVKFEPAMGLLLEGPARCGPRDSLGTEGVSNPATRWIGNRS